MYGLTPLDKDIQHRRMHGKKIYIKDFYDIVCERLDSLEEYISNPSLPREVIKQTKERIDINKKFKELLVILAGTTKVSSHRDSLLSARFTGPTNISPSTSF